MNLSTNKKSRGLGGLFMALVIAAMFLTPAMGVLADTEPNDDFSTAESISSGQYIVGTLDEYSDAEDYYMIWLDSGDTLYVSMTGTGDDFDLDLYDNNQWYADSSAGGSSSESITYTAYSSGNYYIVPYALSGSGSYTLTATVTTGGGTSNGLYVGGTPYVTGDPEAELPTMNVGDSVNWGGVKDIGKDFQDQLQQNLSELQNMGFDANVDANGGLGAYFGMEVVSASTDINGATCYDIQVTGAFAIDFGIDASVKGSTSMYGSTMAIDGSGSGYIKGEANLDGHIYLTVDEMALAKIDLTLTADAHAELNLDATMTAEGQTNRITANAVYDMDGAQVDFLLNFDPPLDVYQFPFWEGKEWYVPGYDTDASGSINAQGTVSYKVDAVVPYQDAVHEDNSTNLATEIGDNNFSTTIPGGEPDWGWGDGGTLFTCTYASGNIFVIETDMGNAFGYLSMPGTRQAGLPDMDSMIPTTGVQYSADSGMITGATVDGELMTQEVTAADVEDFADDPLAEVKSVTGGHDAGSPLLGILLIGVIVIIVVVIVVVMLTKKKTPQQYPPQQYAQQPPPPPPEYQPQQQYQQPPADQYQQPPPPPPPGY